LLNPFADDLLLVAIEDPEHLAPAASIRRQKRLSLASLPRVIHLAFSISSRKLAMPSGSSSHWFTVLPPMRQ
jgi:hypothetical protein